MTSRTASTDEAYVWIWLPGAAAPVVAGRLAREGDLLLFNYGRSYLERDGVIAIYAPELPLTSGQLPLLPGLTMPGCLRDGAPDAWGRRVILNKLLGRKGRQADVDELDELTYLLESGSDRIGALDFQGSASHYEPRATKAATLEELLASAERVERGVPLSPELDAALFHGSSIGGARPKALIDDAGTKYIAKFSSTTDITNIVKAEFIAMRLAAQVGIDVAPVKLVQAAGRDVLLIKRFDREHTAGGWTRRSMVSALTLFGLDDMMARYASYESLAEIIRHRFADPKETLAELYARLVFNILCGNTDDHARNHAAFWDGQTLRLTPAYDLCPSPRTGNEASQAMFITGNERMSKIATCVKAAPNFLLSETAARAIVDQQKAIIEAQWNRVCDEAALSQVDRALLWGRQFLNPFVFEE
jgi:serine/threonine-protein kinase HipA